MPDSMNSPSRGPSTTSSTSSSHELSERTTISSHVALVSSTMVMGDVSGKLREQTTKNKNHSQHQQRPSLLRRFVGALTRKKPLDGRTDTHLNRCLNLLDLTTLGVGSTLGLGLYVLAGQVASNKAGPAVVISFALAALASAFSALCYAEFAGRVPRAGSAYAYSYITVGEFVAFIIGWNLILEYVIGASSVARGFSGYLQFVYSHIMAKIRKQYAQPILALPLSLNQTKMSANNASSLLASALTTNNQLVAQASESLPLANMTMAPSTVWESVIDYVWRYFDWTSIAIVLVLTAFILFGVKESTNLTLIFTAINLTVVIVVVISSLGSLDLHNWQLTKEELPSPSHGEGGFMPYGWSGVLAGSATCFFGFIGFDTIASSAEEAKDPKRNIPLSIILSLFISFLTYVAIAIVQTLLWPYYAQDNITILPYIFDQLNMPITYWIVLLGAIAGLASSQLGGMYPLPRILYSMAQDKLIYGSLAQVNKRLKLPVRATIVGSFFIALLACLLDIQDLADMVSIGTLAAYSLVSLSVLVIRYEDRSDALDDSTMLDGRLNAQDMSAGQQVGSSKMKDQITIFDKEDWQSMSGQRADKTNVNLKPISIRFNNDWSKGAHLKLKPSNATSKQSKVYISMIVALAITLSLVTIGLTSWTNANDGSIYNYVQTKTVLTYGGLVILISLGVLVYLLSRLPNGIKENQADMFMVPLVPITPTLSILVNTFLMLNLSLLTWVRFTVWMAIGLFIYFSYGIWHSEGYFVHLDDYQTKTGGIKRRAS